MGIGSVLDKIKGRAKESAGAATDRDDLRAEGRKDELKGDVKGTADDAADSVSDKLRGAADRLDDESRRRT